MIKKSTEMDFTDHKIAMIVAGLPGIGKTTLALSAPKPLLVDIDKGVHRVEANYRTDTLVVDTFTALREELATADLSEYETIVIDTGGKLFELMKPSIIKENQKNGKADGSLSLQGYGVAKRKYSDFVSFVRGLGKHLVIVFHATEVTLDPDSHLTGLRIRIEGGTKDEIWDDMDLGCFMEMKGQKRVVGFSNCERYYAKGTHGIHGTYEVPTLEKGKPNTFLSDLFKKVNEDLNSDVVNLVKYRKAMALKMFIDNASSVDALNQCFKKMKETEHALTSKEELWFAITQKAKEMGATYVKENGTFEVFDNTESAQ